MVQLERSLAFSKSKLPHSSKPNESSVILFVIGLLILSVLSGVWSHSLRSESNNGINEENIQDNSSKINNNFASLGGWFTENRGQVENPDVKFVFSGSGCSIGFIESGYLIKLTNEKNLTSVVKVTFEGANRVIPEGREQLAHKSNYFRGNDSSKWSNEVGNYEKVVYENLYDGIDLVFYSNEMGLKYDFIVYPEADPNRIRISYHSIEDLYIDYSGNLHVSTKSGEFIEEAPLSYQMINGEMIEVFSDFWTEGNTFGFEVVEYDPSFKFIIDPLIYSTYVGGNDFDEGSHIAVDAENNAYVTGTTYSSNFPVTSGCYDDSNSGSLDVFVFKLNAEGSDLHFSTYFGGSGEDKLPRIALDSENNVYITGMTESADFPTTSGCYDNSQNGDYDIFVSKLSSDGTELDYSTFIGGSGADFGNGITVDSMNSAYVTGQSNSPEFPTTFGCYDPIYNGGAFDAVICKLNSFGSNLQYSTFIGGIDSDAGGDIVLDSGNNAYITGFSDSADFPTTSGCYDNIYNGGRDAITFKLNPDGRNYFRP